MFFIKLTTEECWAIAAASVFIALDVIIGVVCAIIRHDFQSTKMREGIQHKILVAFCIILAILIQGFSMHIQNLGWELPLITPVTVYIVVMEVASILESIGKTYPELTEKPIFNWLMPDQKKEGEQNKTNRTE